MKTTKTTYNQNQVQSLVDSLQNGQRVSKQDLERILADLTKKTLCDLAKALDLHRYSSLCREAVANMILEWYEDMPSKAEVEEDHSNDDQDDDQAPIKRMAINQALEREIAINVYEDLSDEARDYLRDHPELRQNEDHDPTDLRHDIEALVKYYQCPSLQPILEREEGKQTQAKQTEATHLPTLPTIEEVKPQATIEVIQPLTPVIEDKPQATQATQATQAIHTKPSPGHMTLSEYTSEENRIRNFTRHCDPRPTKEQAKLIKYIQANQIPIFYLDHLVTKSELVYDKDVHIGESPAIFTFSMPQRDFDYMELTQRQCLDVLEQCEYFMEGIEAGDYTRLTWNDDDDDDDGDDDDE